MKIQKGKTQNHCVCNILSLQGENIQLNANLDCDILTQKINLEIWGKLPNQSPIFLPKNPDKSLKKYGSVENYKKSPDRALLHHITIGQYLTFQIKAINYFTNLNNHENKIQIF